MVFSFLNPSILWALLAISVPIIIHFFNLQRPKKVLFSNVAFVKEVKKSVVRNLQITQWLLLLLRILAIACLVLAFAHPVILHDDASLAIGNRSVAIVIDNSYSMTASNEKGSYLQQALSLSREIIRSYSRQDEFLFMTNHDLKLNYNFARQEETLQEVRSLSPVQNTFSHADLLEFSDEIFTHASFPIKELYFLSDFQSSTILTDSAQLSLPDSNILIKYIPLATRSQNNVYIKAHKILSQIIEKDKPVKMSMELANDGSSVVTDLGLRVILEGNVVAIHNQTLSPNQSENISLTFTPKQSGWLSGYVEIDNDPIDFDNKRFFTVYVPEKESVLVVEGQASPNVRILFDRLFEQFDSDFISMRNLSGQNLNEYRSMVLVGVNQVSSGLADKLSNYLENGGSIMVFPGDQLDIANMNRWFSSMKAGKWQVASSIQEGILAEQSTLEHPIFDGVYTEQQQNREFDAPRIFTYHPVRLNNATVQNRIISLENQDPIMFESKVGQGLLYAFTIFPADNWSDFHVKTIFAPLMLRATQIMNQTQNVEVGQVLGQLKPELLQTVQKSNIFLRPETPGNDPTEQVEYIVEQYPQRGVTILNFEKLALTEGAYRLEQDGGLLKKIAFNISDLESKLAFFSQSELEKYSPIQQLPTISVINPQAETISQQIQMEKQGLPLWKYFIIFALVFLLGEIALLNLKKSTNPDVGN